MRDVVLGDRRLEERARSLVALFDRAPEKSLPKATQTAAELEGAYRFFRNHRVTLDKLLAPHVAATAERARAASSPVIVAHDTTELRFGGEAARDGLGDLTHGGQGFFAHVALTVTEERQVLGVAGVQTHVWDPERRTHRERIDYARRSPKHTGTRWRAVIEDVQARMGDTLPIHVMDREADEFELMSDLREMGIRFVVRASAARRRKVARVDGAEMPKLPIEAAAFMLKGSFTRDVILSARKGQSARRGHGVRDRRPARLRYAAGTVEVLSPRNKRGGRRVVTVNLVHVIEDDPPRGEAPVEWLLYSNEPIRSTEDVLAIVDAYRARWVIEEYFKALKTGCAVERRQLESFDALVNCLGMFMPIAAKMLALRTCARLRPDEPATTLLSQSELGALRLVVRKPLPTRVTVEAALYAIAALGGHLRANGPPGWLTLAQGFETLHVAVLVYERSRKK